MQVKFKSTKVYDGWFECNLNKIVTTLGSLTAQDATDNSVLNANRI